MRLTSPQIHSSIITSPTTTTRRPLMRASSSAARGAAISSVIALVTLTLRRAQGNGAPRDDPLGGAQQVRRAQIGLGPVVRIGPGHENAGNAHGMPERDVAAAVAHHRAAVEREPVLFHRAVHHAGRGLAARAVVAVMRAPVPGVDRDAVVREPPHDLVVHRAHRVVVEIPARNAGLVRHDHRGEAALAQQPQRVDDRRQDLDAVRIVQEPLVVDDRPVPVEKHGGPAHANSSSCSTRSQMMWPIVMCTSCTIALEPSGPTSARSATSATAPPPLPVNAIVVAPISFAFSSPRTTFFDVPLVVMPTTTSPGCASASTMRAKSIS